MGQWHNTRTNDVVDVPEALDGKYEANPEWEKAKAPAKKSTSNTGSN